MMIRIGLSTWLPMRHTLGRAGILNLGHLETKIKMFRVASKGLSTTGLLLLWVEVMRVGWLLIV